MNRNTALDQGALITIRQKSKPCQTPDIYLTGLLIGFCRTCNHHADFHKNGAKV